MLINMIQLRHQNSLFVYPSLDNLSNRTLKNVGESMYHSNIVVIITVATTRISQVLV